MSSPSIETTGKVTTKRRIQGFMAVRHELSDEELMQLFQQGTIAAFDVLVERYTGPLMRFLQHFISDERVCEDLLQETFLRVYRNRLSYRQIAKVSTWVYTIAGNLARSEYRKRKRQRTTSLFVMTQNDEEFEQDVPDESYMPDVLTDDQLYRRHIQDALGEIPSDYREVVVLRDIQQLSYEEIAEITGLPMGTVKSRINRGRTKLQQLLKDVYPFPTAGA